MYTYIHLLFSIYLTCFSILVAASVVSKRRRLSFLLGNFPSVIISHYDTNLSLIQLVICFFDIVCALRFYSWEGEGWGCFSTNIRAWEMIEIRVLHHIHILFLLLFVFRGSIIASSKALWGKWAAVCSVISGVKIIEIENISSIVEFCALFWSWVQISVWIVIYHFQRNHKI